MREQSDNRYVRSQMYSVGRSLPVERLGSGTFLLSGPAMSGKYELLLDLLTEGFEHGEGGLAITANQGAASIVEDIEARYGSVPDRLRVVDCVSENQGTTSGGSNDRITYVSSPADLTGIGIRFSEQLGQFTETEIDRIRVGFYSLSTLLMYTELETVFRFVHVISGRIDSVDALGVFALDPTTHEDNTVSTLKQLFDGMIEVRETEGERQVRLVNVPDAPEGWTARP